jgi:hypothetical protein
MRSAPAQGSSSCGVEAHFSGLQRTTFKPRKIPKAIIIKSSFSEPRSRSVLSFQMTRAVGRRTITVTNVLIPGKNDKRTPKLSALFFRETARRNTVA